MGVNNVNNGSPVTWSNLNPPKTDAVDVAKVMKPINSDKLELNLPIAETIYKRKEFVTDERFAEGCGFCYTYMERTLTFADGKGGPLTIVSGSSDGYFTINMDKHERTFGKSGVNMNDLGHAVEETWERRERSIEQSTISAGLSGAVTGNGQTVGGSLGFAAQSTAYKYTSASVTKGTAEYKNGGLGKYRENAFTSREIYNKCAVFLAEAFEEKSSELTLGDKEFNELFGKLGGDEKTFSSNAARKREKLDNQLERLRRFMDEKLAAVRENDPNNRGLKVFADTRLKLGTYNYSDIAALAEKLFTEGNAAR